MLHTHGMDAGLAAVIAGASGAGGAALAALATSLGLVRQAKIQGDQAHRQWLRNHQQQSYEDLMVAVDRAHHASRDAMRAVRNQLPGTEMQQATIALLEDVRLQGRSLQAVVQRVALLADQQTTTFALVLCDRVLDVIEVSLDIATEMRHGQPLTEERLERAADEAEEARSQFLDRARSMLQQA
ncbi:hypothetical protein B1H20_16870 [Streptomyces violaceoruber]|uniref:Cyclodeaminase/cyclohydrolase domain-containing protein n=2 Tax=Streptomyces violaceoruber TaxID=1935 RepID=A0A1V0UCB8_STRVN|nr:hypothetical protein B1H20_16870 [Streptomyces violaceoruber]